MKCFACRLTPYFAFLKPFLLVVSLLISVEGIWGQSPFVYTFTSKVFESNNQSKILSNNGYLPLWNIVYTANSQNYLGYDGTKGQQIGSGSSAVSSLSLTTSDFTSPITSISIETSGASATNAKFNVSVSNVSSSNSPAGYSLTASNSSYLFTFNSSLGEIDLQWSQTSSKALYIKKITIYFASCTAPSDPSGMITSTVLCGSADLSYTGTVPVGQTYYWQNSATGTSTANDASSTNSVSGSGNYYVRALDASGTCWSAGTQVFTLGSIPHVPIILSQPSSATIYAGTTVNLSVTATNAINYQWQQRTNSGGIWVDVPGATNTNYTTPVLSLSDNGKEFRVMVVGDPICSNVQSSAAEITVDAPYVDSINNQNSYVGQNMSLTAPMLTGTSASNWTAILPAGLTIDLNSGTISGTIIESAGLFLARIECDLSPSGLHHIENVTWNIQNPSLDLIANKANFIGGSINLAVHPLIPSSGLSADSWSASGLPSGLSINSSTGSITGTITATPGTYSCSISANFMHSPSDSKTFNWVISLAPVVCFSDDFSWISSGSNGTTTGSSSSISTSVIWSSLTQAYQAGGAIKLGSGSNSGSISTNFVATSSTVEVDVDVKGWTTVEGSLVITLGAQSVTLPYTATIGQAFQRVSTTFTNVPTGSNIQLSLATTAKRMFIDQVDVRCITLCTIPQTPLVGSIIETPGCGNAALDIATGTIIPNGESYFWQTTSAGTATTHQANTTFNTTVAGTYYLRAKSTVGNCWSASALSYQVNSIPPAVAITIQPSNTSAALGGSFTMSASVANATNYQWQYSATSGGIFSDILGQTSSTLLVSNASASDAGYYHLLVSNANCTPLASTAVQLTVNTLTISPVTAQTVVYGGTYSLQMTSNNPNATYTMSTNISGLSMSLSGLISGQVSQAVSPTNLLVITANANGYNTSYTFNLAITPKVLNVSGLTVVSKIYDGTTVASFSGTPTLIGILFSDIVQLDHSNAVAAFNSKNAGSSKAVLVNNVALSGTHASNYSISSLSLTGDITQKPITITGYQAQNKVYDGTTTATITGVALNGILPGDVVNHTVISANFSSAQVGNNILVNFSLALVGADSGNYSYPANGSSHADITSSPSNLSASVITILQGSNFSLTLPNASISSSSSGMFTYVISSGGFATLSGSTLLGVNVGNDTLAITQAADNNYAAGSVNVLVKVVPPVTYYVGDYRTVPNVTGTVLLSNAAKWEVYDGSNWVIATSSPQVVATTPQNIYINDGDNVNFSSGRSGGYENIYINAPNIGIASTNTTTGIIIQAGKVMDIRGGRFDCLGKFTLAANSHFIVRSGAEASFGSTNSNISIAGTAIIEVEDGASCELYGPNLRFWTGIEKFHPHSNFYLTFWNINEKLFSNSSDISDFMVGSSTAKFGNLFIDNTYMTNGDWKNILPIGTYQLTHNDFNVNSGIAGKNVTLTSISTGSTPISDITIGRDFNATGVGKIAIQSTASIFHISRNLNVSMISNGVAFMYQGNSSNTLYVHGDLNLFSGQFNLNSTSAGLIANTLNLYGNLYKDQQSSLLNSNSAGFATINFMGSSVQTIDVSLSTTLNDLKHMKYIAQSGSKVKLLSDLTLVSSGTTETDSTYFRVSRNSEFDFSFSSSNNPFCINREQANTNVNGYFDYFLVESGATIKISSPDGITNWNSFLGNVRTSRRVYHAVANYHYTGKINQVTGNGLPAGASSKKVIVELGSPGLELRPTAATQFTQNANGVGTLQIIQGTVIDDGILSFKDAATGTGALTMTGGTYWYTGTVPTGTSSSVFPFLSGNYNLSGGEIRLAHAGSSGYQRLRGGKTYHKITTDGTGSNTNLKNISGNIVINDSLLIKGTSIFDTESHHVTGAGTILMDKSEYRTSTKTIPQPELTGPIAYMPGANSRFVFYGTNSSNYQVINATKTFQNIHIIATGKNITPNQGNVTTNAGLNVLGDLRVDGPSVLAVTGSNDVYAGSFAVNQGATFMNGTTLGLDQASNSGVVKSSLKYIDVEASLAFSNSGTTPVGSYPIPELKSLHVLAGDVSFDAPMVVKDTLELRGGNLLPGTASAAITIGESLNRKGIVDRISGLVLAPFTRWMDGVNSGAASGLFPVGVMEAGVVVNRSALIEYTSSSTTGGKLALTIQQSPMGSLGLPIASANSGGAGFEVVHSSGQGYWEITPEAGALSDGVYTISLTGGGITTVYNSSITLLKRVNGGAWFAPGQHIAMTGTFSEPTIARSRVSGWSNFGIGGGVNNPLPVELKSFSISCEDAATVLRWVTASEKNSKSFEVQYSVDLGKWETLALVDSQGDSNFDQAYQVVDLKLRNLMMYYRLLQMDYDGEERFYDPKSSTCYVEAEALQVHPNPNQGEFVVELFSENERKGVAMSISSLDGKIVQARSVDLVVGVNQLFVSGEELQGGIYLVHLMKDGVEIGKAKVLIN